MSNNSWISTNITGANPPNGMYNDNTDDTNGGAGSFLQSGKRQKIINYKPGGQFDSHTGLTDTIDSTGRNPQQLTKNLMSTQTQYTLYINVPRMIIPIYIPSTSGKMPFLLRKSVVSGDVFFHIRFNHKMFSNRSATPCANTLSPNMNTVINLQTVNYILNNIQIILFKLQPEMVGLNGITFDEFKVSLTQRINEIKTQDNEWIIFLNNITSDGAKKTFFDTFLCATSEFYRNWYYRVIVPNRQDYLRLNGNNEMEQIVMQHMEKQVDAHIHTTCWEFINTYMRLGGVFIGSDNQGGMDQQSLNPCSYAPTDYVGTLQLAGKSLKVRNLWHTTSLISSGAIIGFYLKKFDPEYTTINFNLSSNPLTRESQLFMKTSPTYTPFFLTPGVYETIQQQTQQQRTKKCYADHFLSFGSIDQMSKCGNVESEDNMSVCYNAESAILPMPVQVMMRFKFYKNNTQIIHPNTFSTGPDRVAVREGGGEERIHEAIPIGHGGSDIASHGLDAIEGAERTGFGAAGGVASRSMSGMDVEPTHTESDTTTTSESGEPGNPKKKSSRARKPLLIDIAEEPGPA